MSKENLKKIAEERIQILFKQAYEALNSGETERSKRYIRLAKSIGMKSQTPIPRALKRRFCKKCFSLFIPGKTVRTRIKKGSNYITYSCLVCGNIQRYPFSKEQKALKSKQNLRR
jgi:ribonuclease P protein subunit RPR2